MSGDDGYYNWNNGYQPPDDNDYGPAGVYGSDPQVDPFQNDPFENERKRREEKAIRERNGEPDPEQQQEQSQDDRKLTFKGTMVDFAETTTLHGVPRLVSTEGIWPYLWTVVILSVTGIFFYLFSSLIIRYFSYPTNITNKVIYKEVEFPAISVCNLNNLRASAVEQNEQIKLAMDAFDSNLQNQLQGDLESLAPAARRKREALGERQRRRKRQTPTCGAMGCPLPNSRVGFWPLTKEEQGYDRSGFDNKVYFSPTVADSWVEGPPPANLTNGALYFDGNVYSYAQIENNGALDVQQSFTWVAYVKLHNVSVDSPLFVWLPNTDGFKRYASGLVARIKDGIITYHMSLVNKRKDIAGVYAMEAKIMQDQWHMLAVSYDAFNGDIHFRVDDETEMKHHMLWVNESHDTMTEVRIGSYEPNGPEYLSKGAMNGAMSCIQLFNYHVNLSLLEELIEVQPCECVNNSCPEPTTTTTTTIAPFVNFTTTEVPVGKETPRLDVADEYFVPDVEEKPWFDPGSPAAAVQNAQNFSRLLREISLMDRRTMGHQLDTLLQACTYDTAICTPLNFTGFTNGKFGNCYTFNGPLNIGYMNASKPGSLYGLVLTLYIEQHEYISALSSSAGVRLLVHLQDVQPFPEDSEGIDVMPGRKTSVSVRKRDYIRLGGDFSDCTDGSEVDLMYNANYSDGACFRTCRQRKTIEDCGCGEASLPVPDETEACLSDADIGCSEEVKNKFEKEIYVCACPNICEESIFITSVATSEWPGKAFEQTIIDEYSKRDPTIKEVLQSKDGIRKNFLKLEVFYDDIMYELVVETEAYPSSSLLADIGGQLGLWLGLSILTLVEIIQLFFDIATLCCRRKRVVVPHPR